MWKELGVDQLAKRLELREFCSKHPGHDRCKKLEADQAYCAVHPMDAERCDRPSAARLMQECDSESSEDHAYCAGTLDGLLDNGAAPQLGPPMLPQIADPPEPSLLCVPVAVLRNPEQVRLLFVRAAHDHPEVLHLSARRLLYYTLAKTFPCPNPIKDSPR
jgi:hypothetical protein